MTRNVRAGLVAIATALLAAGCATSLKEPANIEFSKRELRQYVASGQYMKEILMVATEAKAWIEQRAAHRVPGERLALVMDLDETLLFNWPEIQAADFAYDPVRWNAWVESAAAHPGEPVREIYEVARNDAVEIFFITGRRERYRDATAKNLQRIQCSDSATLICRPADSQGTAAAFKTAARKQLVQEGHVIIANVGDQLSDLSGGFAERTFKLPDPFYFAE